MVGSRTFVLKRKAKPPMQYLFLDTETGGLGPDTSLLTVGLLVCDSRFNILDSLHQELMPDDGIYHVTGGGLSVNKINLVEHSKVAKKYKEWKTPLFLWLQKHSKDGADKLVPVGKQVDGDIRKIHENLLTKNTWEQCVSHRSYDVSSVFWFLKSLGFLKEIENGGLGELCEYFGVEHANQHNALADCYLTREVLCAMREILVNILDNR